MDVAMDAATTQMAKMTTSNPWDYARAIVTALRSARMIDPARERWQDDGSLPDDLPMCGLCDEPITPSEPGPEFGSWTLKVHRECALRSGIGGIGHLIAHDYWCTQRKDPDAGLTYRQSALLVDEFVAVVGVDATVRRG